MRRLTAALAIAALALAACGEPDRPTIDAACDDHGGLREWEELDSAAADLAVCNDGEALEIEDVG